MYWISVCRVVCDVSGQVGQVGWCEGAVARIRWRVLSAASVVSARRFLLFLRSRVSLNYSPTSSSSCVIGQ